MSNRTELLLNKTEESDDKVLARITINLTQKWKINTTLDSWDFQQTEMTEEQQEDAARALVKFFGKDLIARAFKWNADLWASNESLSNVLYHYIKDSAQMLMMRDKEFEALIKACKKEDDD